MLSTDQTLTCVACGTAFAITAAEQAQYAEKGQTPPKRCQACQAASGSQADAPASATMGELRTHAPLWAGIPREIHAGERRVAATPETVKKLRSMGFAVRVESGAGSEAQLSDDLYREAGAEVTLDRAEVWTSDLVLKVRAPEGDEPELLKDNLLVSLLWPAQNQDLMGRIAARGASAIALDQIPRISRAQKMDVLSSMANIAGYRAVVEAASAFTGLFAGQITAAGKTRPAQVLVIGAGVAGLAAIGTARGLGAEVRAFDVRKAAKEQVESMGASFLTVEITEEGEASGGYAKEMSPAFVEAEMALFMAQAKEVDIIITTAQIPGKRAPILITADMVRAMRPGSVVVDLAAEQGGNCELTQPGKVVVEHGVSLVGYLDLPSRLPTHASQFLGSNLCHLLSDMGGGETFTVDLDNDVIYQALVIQDGQVRFPVTPRAPKEAPKAAAPQVAAAPAAAAPTPAAVAPAKAKGHGHGAKGGARGGKVLGLITAAVLAVMALFAPADFLQHFTVFVLACFVGWQVIWSVTPALHTPLMSVTNAISGIILVGGMLAAGNGTVGVASVLGAVAVLVASINIAGGFLVTQRMLAMFRKEGT
jgi:NAD(P) transhydrogenase subunit alpha